MRRRILLAIVGVALVAVLAVAVPLALVGERVVRDDNRDQLERQVQGIALGLTAGPVELDRALLEAPEGQLEIRLGRGSRATVRVGDAVPPPTASASAVNALGDLVTLTVAADRLDDGVARLRLVVAAVVAAVLVGATLTALALARRLTAPLQDLAHASARIGDGEFDVRMPRSGLAEVDAVAEALDRSAHRVQEMLSGERQFSANASHQLRTAVTGLRLRLEQLEHHDLPDAARADVARLIGSADRLEEVLTSLLSLARRGRAGDATAVDVAALVRAQRDRWADRLGPQRRELRIEGPDTALARAVPAALGQAVDVLVDNAARHGGGTVTVGIEVRPTAVVIAVSDTGEGLTDDEADPAFARGVSFRGGSGLGLPLARALVEADGGRLVLARRRPPRFEITLPAAPGSFTSA